MSTTFRKLGIILAIGTFSASTLMLSACTSPMAGDGKSYATLADLKRRDIQIEQQELEPVPPEQVLDTYNQAIDLFTTADERNLALRRMADLTMVATEDRVINSLDETPEVSAEGVQDSNIPATQDAGGNLQYGKAIALYVSLIAAAPAGSDLAEEYYLLAKAYDMDGQSEKALETLNLLVSQYPNSPYTAEAQFRRGEHLFQRGLYEEAAVAYAAVLTVGKDTEFYEHSLYKHGWTLYKLGDFDLAVTDFIALLDVYLPAPPPKTAEEIQAEEQDGTPRIEAVVLPEVTGTQRKTMDDTLRVLSMSFSNLDGADSVFQYFNQNGSRIYEHEVYKALGELYLYQERYKDAADTYAMFAAKHPLHPMAPTMSSQEIASYQKGGFPSLVLPAKENFVKQYGVYSAYWAQATPAAREQYSADLKQHLVELAKHYHALAQTSKLPEDYLNAARWYREFLATYPNDESAPVMNMLLGETLFAAKDYRAAIEEFERTAYDYPANEGTEKAAYFALLAHQEQLKQIPKDDPTYKGLVAKRVSSSLRFAKAYPVNEHAPEILDSVIEDELYLNDLEGVITATQLVINLVPPAPQPLREKAWITYANAIFDKQQYREAEIAYTKVLEIQSLPKPDRATYEERLATCVYKQGEALEKEGKLAEAAGEYLRVGVVVPSAAVRANAEYDAANILLQLGQNDKAITVLENFRKTFPNHELTKSVPQKLSLAYEQTGNLGAAATELIAIAAMNKSTDPELARKAIWQAAEMKEKSGDTTAAMNLYKDYTNDYPQPYDLNMEAQYKLAEMYGKAGDSQKRYFWLHKLDETYPKAGPAATPRMQYLAAYGAFNSAEAQYADFDRIRLTQPLKKSLTAKKNALQKVSDAYTHTIKIGVIEFTTSANFKLGEAYSEFAKAIMKSERPRGMDADTQEEYELLLEDQALPFEDKAIAILQTNTERTKDGIWDQWIEKSYESLRKLSPGRYNKAELSEEVVDVIY